MERGGLVNREPRGWSAKWPPRPCATVPEGPVLDGNHPRDTGPLSKLKVLCHRGGVRSWPRDVMPDDRARGQRSSLSSQLWSSRRARKTILSPCIAVARTLRRRAPRPRRVCSGLFRGPGREKRTGGALALSVGGRRGAKSTHDVGAGCIGPAVGVLPRPATQ